MKIAVSSTGGSLNAQVAENFGRSPYLLIVDSITMKFEPLLNPAASMMGGAGPAAAQLAAQRGAGVLLTGVAGPNALKALAAYGIETVSGAKGSVREALESYLSDKKYQTGK